jgi:hypothetical protein
MTTRRDFIRKAALGSAAISSVGGLSVLNAKSSSDGKEKKDFGITVVEQPFPGWEVSFDEPTSSLLLKNGPVSIQGQLTFVSGTNKWIVAKSMDGLPDRYSVLDMQGNVHGNIVLQQNCEQLQLFFIYLLFRTVQSKGLLSFEGTITFLADSYACRTRAKAGERVLSLSCGSADSLLNDSIFSPESDTTLRLDTASLHLKTVSAGSYSFAMLGQIDELSEAMFKVNLEKDYFKIRNLPYYHALDRKRCPKAPTGWMSWNTYFDKATGDDNLAEARIGQKYLQPFGCDIWSIESWQGNSPILPVRNFYNMNLEVDGKKFPKGMKKLADDIRKLGFRPGIWMAPFGTGSKEFYDAHKDWFLHDKVGKPVSSWNGIYTLDPSVSEAREHLKKIHNIASREWGYEFFKIDGMSTLSLYERPEIKAQFRDKSCPNPYELCIKAFREGIGEDRVLLACGGRPSGPAALYSDAYRIGGDIVTQFKPPQWNGIVRTGLNLVNQVFANDVVMYTDPDTLLVHDLPLEEARVFTTLVALPGQLTFFGDKLAGLSGDQMKMLQQTLPVADVRPTSLYPYFSTLSVWNLRVHNKMLDDYNVVALFNWEDESKTIAFTTEELGIDSDPQYSLFEFWTLKDLGSMKDKFEMEVPAHSVRLLSMHKANTVPQWISSDRHVTQNGIELKEYEWKGDSRTLEGKIQLIGKFPLTMRLRVPEGYTFSNAECTGAKCSAKKEENNILAVAFYAGKKGDFAFRIKF